MLKHLISMIVFMLSISATFFVLNCGGETKTEKLKVEELDKEERKKMMGRTIKSVDRISGDIVIWFTDGSHALINCQGWTPKVEFTEDIKDIKK